MGTTFGLSETSLIVPRLKRLCNLVTEHAQSPTTSILLFDVPNGEILSAVFGGTFAIGAVMRHIPYKGPSECSAGC